MTHRTWLRIGRCFSFAALAAACSSRPSERTVGADQSEAPLPSDCHGTYDCTLLQIGSPQLSLPGALLLDNGRCYYQDTTGSLLIDLAGSDITVDDRSFYYDFVISGAPAELDCEPKGIQ